MTVVAPGYSQLPVDLRLSPYTGWTWAHWEATADRMLLAVRRYTWPDGEQDHLTL